MNGKEIIERKIFLKLQLIEITKREIADLKTQLKNTGGKK